MEEDQEVEEWVRGWFEGQPDNRNLIASLLALQKRFGYLSRAGMRAVAGHLDRSPADVYGVATFYNQFRFVPPGRYPIKVYMGTACHIKGGQKILEHWERSLGIEEGQVTDDREYSLDRVACVGCCTLAPVTLIGDEVIGYISPTKIDGLMLQHDMQRKENAGKDDDHGS